MADSRINLLTSASSTASDDFFVVDGTTNGTRKLNAFSPTIGGNLAVTGTLTVSGNTTLSGNLDVASGISTGTAQLQIGNGRTGSGYAYVDLVGDTTYSDYGFRIIRNNGGANTSSELAHRGTGDFALVANDAAPIKFYTNGVTAATIAATTGNTTIHSTTASLGTSSGALVVSGGVGVAGAIYAANLGGTSTNNNAASGCIGEYASATTAYASKVSLTSNTAANIVSISLTAGDWDVQFNPVFTQDTSLTTSGVLAGVSSSSGVLPSSAAERAHSPSGPNGNSDLSIAPPVTRISLASTTTIYGVATGIFSAGTMSAYGFIRARRVR